VDARIWRLTRKQIDLSAADLLGDKTAPAAAIEQPEPADSGFANTEASMLLNDAFLASWSRAVSKLVGETLAGRLSTVFPEGETKLGDDAVVKAWVVRFGRRAFRRPLAQAEVDTYFGLYATYKPKLDAKTAFGLVLEAFLQSPHFLFRTELGSGKPDARGRVTLTPHEVAAQLGYYLTNGLPDAELDAAADAADPVRSILSRAELEKHARRLLASDRAKATFWDFFFQYLDYDLLPQELNKTGSATNVFNPAKPSLTKESETFIKDLIWTDDAAAGKLFSASHTFVDSALSRLYGVADPGAGKWAKVMLDAKDRAGVLTHAAVMARFSHPTETSPILRGYFVAERVLCVDFPPPPEGAADTKPSTDPNKTTRQKVAELTEGATTCGGCHKVINPPGYLFEHLDQFGRVRRTEGPNLPINTAVTLAGAGDVDGAFMNVGEFAIKLAASQRARECLSRQVFRFAHGAKDRPEDQGAVAEMLAAFNKGNGNLKELLLSHVLSERFITRRAN
jgi:hypothetical protein